jgi:hypothetical protein
VALISALIDKTEMLEFGANFIVYMKWYEIPISFIKIVSLEKLLNYQEYEISVQNCVSKHILVTSILSTYKNYGSQIIFLEFCCHNLTKFDSLDKI